MNLATLATLAMLSGFTPEPTLHPVFTPPSAPRNPGSEMARQGFGSVRTRSATKDRVTVPWSAGLDLDELTVEVLFRLLRVPAYGDGEWLVQRGNLAPHTTKPAYGVEILGPESPGTTGPLRINALFSHGNAVAGGAVAATVELGRWYSVAFTYDGANLLVYLQARAFGATPGAATYTLLVTFPVTTLPPGTPVDGDGYPLLLGAEPTLASVADVELTEPRISASALSKATLDARLAYRLTATQAIATELYMPCDDGVEGGRTVRDASGHGHDGTFSGIALWGAGPPDLYYP